MLLRVVDTFVETVNAVWPNMIKTKSVIVETDEAVYITPLPNPYERD